MSNPNLPKTFFILFVLLICLFSFGVASAAEESFSPPFSGAGLGTEEDPYQITSIKQLDEVRNHLNSSFILMNDLDFADSEIQNWTPIGTTTTAEGVILESFQGNFDGNNKTIYNLTVYIPSIGFLGNPSGGLFNRIERGNVSNLNFENASVTADNAGILATSVWRGVVDNIHISNSTVSGGFSGGFLVDSVSGGTISNSTIQDSFLNSDSKGGMVVSFIFAGTITNSHVHNSTLITVFGGGIADVTRDSRIDNSSVTNSTIKAKGIAGGISGTVDIWLGNSIIENCYVKNTSIVGSHFVGGIAGQAFYSEIRNCYTAASIHANHLFSRTGGIVGYSHNSRIENCIAVNERLNHYNGTISYFFGIATGRTGENPIAVVLHAPWLFRTGRVAGTSVDSTFKNCYYWDGVKSNKIILNSRHGDRVNSARINDFPNGIWEEWDQTIWMENPNEGEFLPVLRSEFR